MEPTRICLIMDKCGRLVPDYFHYINMHVFECHEYRISLVNYVSIIIITITNLIIMPELHTVRGYSYRLRPNLNHCTVSLNLKLIVFLQNAIKNILYSVICMHCNAGL